MIDVIIIGGGPAGLTAGLYLKRSGFNAVLFESAFSGGQAALTSNIENYPGFGSVSGFELAMKMEEQAKSFGLEIVNDPVTEACLSGEIKQIKTASGEHSCRAVIISTGASPKKLGLPNEEKLTGSGISYCATCDGAFFADKNVAIVGGGNTAAEDALFLSKRAKKVYLIHRRDNLRAEKAYKTRLSESGIIEIIYESTVKSILEKDAKVCGLELLNNNGSTRELAVDGVFVAVGTTPNSGLFDEIQKDDAGYILCDENMRTNLDGVFAAGDVRKTPLRQIVTAAADGAVAANSVAIMLS